MYKEGDIVEIIGYSKFPNSEAKMINREGVIERFSQGSNCWIVVFDNQQRRRDGQVESCYLQGHFYEQDLKLVQRTVVFRSYEV